MPWLYLIYPSFKLLDPWLVCLMYLLSKWHFSHSRMAVPYFVIKRCAVAASFILFVKNSMITLTPYMVLPLFAIRFAEYAGGHPSLFHTATSLLIGYKMFCVRDISYRLKWMEFINMFYVYAQSGMHSHFNWWIIVVLTYNPPVLMCVEITDTPKL